jgi:predicted ribosomally synthesized peptide with SipW-like signal peptide
VQISKKQLVLGASGITAVVALATAGTLAVFTSTSTPSANTFTTGTIILAQDMANGALSYTSGGGMMPGHTVQSPVVVSNGSTPAAAANLQLRYAITVSTTGSAPLAAAMVLTVQQTDDNSAAGVCTNHTGHTLYTGPLSGATAGRVVGSPARGQYDDGSATTYNDDRLLASGASERLCFTVSLPDTVSDPTLQGTSVVATFNFTSEQTVNNALTESPTP